ncbi:MAG TPA: hypothetical protein VFU63_13315 [Ktedonobacterales bacterium]|nr:hypothetical protein [Ktedonobacterales bacterium]
MNREERAQAQEEQTERATQQATDLVRAYSEDPDAWVRLLFTAGMGDEAVYHFDAFWPRQTQNEQSRVIVQRVVMGRWTATFVEDPLATLSIR